MKSSGFLEEALVAAVVAMTRHNRQANADFGHPAAYNPIAPTVKIADLRNNLDMTRVADPTFPIRGGH
ncbi:hypothetical protein E4191_03735 [Paracoccus liaowanqingii]|uniref:Uncharacterized protein n=1 Tax=Paracoccus liaowanqingii TaxID=2560053 RepID=A0A4P7HJX4_9RHOB|nr:hypothetical protein [Paracoccus liaowanqingii]QBX33920.1 hypothetical protein E4191_03735 [Paracoccus liaowanqingii]